MPERREKKAASVQFRNELLESRKRINYQSEFDRLQGAKRLAALFPNVKTRMKELQQTTRQSLKGEPAHATVSFQNFKSFFAA